MTTPLTGTLRRRLALANELYVDLVAQLPASSLGARLRELPSDSIQNQLRCVVGARESYTKAARAGSWQGFASSLDHVPTGDADAVRAAVRDSHTAVEEFLDGLDPADDYALNQAFALLEHETQHHGQLIRYLYGLGIPRPASWQRQYALDGD
ncbi:hypothetical protein [Microbacterium sp.]|jgi:uncharacterized damage-inducible protein DinB|uniref:hypothetical protein n=1 Tax=Microbacterium sp. TaxID=51671 RepID=UPI0035AE1974